MIIARQRKTKSFTEKLKGRFDQGKFLCVGLDPSEKELEKVHNRNSAEDSLEYLTDIVNAIAPFAAAFKMDLRHKIGANTND